MPSAWSTVELGRYTKGYSQTQKDAIIKSLLASDIINQFLSTPEGKVVCDTLIERISSLLGAILEYCDKGVEANIQDIELAALKIKLTRDFILELASVAYEGDRIKLSIEANK